MSTILRGSWTTLNDDREVNAKRDLPKLILLPGMDGTGLLFTSMLQHLDKSIPYEVIPMPQKGDQSYRRQINHAMDKIGVDNVLLFAESYAGYIALQLSSRLPNQIKHIVFAASFISRPSFLTTLAKLIPVSVVTQFKWPSPILNTCLMGGKGNPKAYIAFQKAVKRPPLAVLHARINNMHQLPRFAPHILTPCTLIKPKRDFLVSKHAHRQLKIHCNVNKELTLNGGHFIALSNPKGCADILNDIYKQFTEEKDERTKTKKGSKLI